MGSRRRFRHTRNCWREHLRFDSDARPFHRLGNRPLRTRVRRHEVRIESSGIRTSHGRSRFVSPLSFCFGCARLEDLLMSEPSFLAVAKDSVAHAFFEYFAPLIRMRRRRVIRRQHRALHEAQLFLAAVFSMLAAAARARLDHLTEAEFLPLLAHLTTLKAGLHDSSTSQLPLWESLGTTAEECEQRVQRLITVIETAAAQHRSDRLRYQDLFSALAAAVAADIQQFFLYHPPRFALPSPEEETRFALASQRVVSLLIPVGRDALAHLESESEIAEENTA